MAKIRNGRRKSKHRKQSTTKVADAGGVNVDVDVAVGATKPLNDAKNDIDSHSSDPSSTPEKRKEVTSTEDHQNEAEGSQPPSKKRRKTKRKRSSAQPSSEKETKESKDGASDQASEVETTVVNVPDFPYPIDADDHCESPLEAYSDIAPLLTLLCGTNKTSDSLRIYDPYYCDGAVIRNLAELGFSNVYNRKEDCYAVWASPSTPKFDVLVTNPPYSDDHIEKLIRYITSSSFGNRPWFLLLPQWAHKKNFYVQATARIRPFYLVPRKRYVYVPPKHFRASKKSDVHKKSSPFVSMWYCWGGAANDALLEHYYKNCSTSASGCDLARSKSALRDLRRKQR